MHWINHKKFGWGRVIRYSDEKVVVQFESGTKALPKAAVVSTRSASVTGSLTSHRDNQSSRKPISSYLHKEDHAIPFELTAPWSRYRGRVWL